MSHFGPPDAPITVLNGAERQPDSLMVAAARRPMKTEIASCIVYAFGRGRPVVMSRFRPTQCTENGVSLTS